MTIAPNIWLGGCPSLKTVGVREQVAFEVLGSRVQVANQSHVLGGGGQKALFRSQLRILDRLRDVEEVEAFGNGHRVGVHVAAHDAVVDRGKRCRLCELVFPRFQRASAHHMPKVEGVAVAHDPVPFQQGADPARTHARGYFDQGSAGGLAGTMNSK